MTLADAILIYRYPYLFPDNQAEALATILAAQKGLRE